MTKSPAQEENDSSPNNQAVAAQYRAGIFWLLYFRFVFYWNSNNFKVSHFKVLPQSQITCLLFSLFLIPFPDR